MRRARVDHDRLAVTVPGTPAWDQRLRDLGLDTVSSNDPALPAELRDLLRAGTLPPTISASVELRGKVMGTLAAVMALALGFSELGWLALGLAGLAGWWVDRHICESEPKIPVGPAVRDRALASLRQRPFVRVVGETVIENLPVAAWLAAQAEELEAALGETVSRADLIREAEARIATLRDAVGASSPDPTRDGLGEVLAREAVRTAQIEAALRGVRARREAVDLAREQVVSRAELASWVHRSGGLTPATEPAASPEDRAAADLEVDIADLRSEVEAVWTARREDEARFGALYAAARARVGR